LHHLVVRSYAGRVLFSGILLQKHSKIKAIEEEDKHCAKVIVFVGKDFQKEFLMVRFEKKEHRDSFVNAIENKVMNG